VALIELLPLMKLAPDLGPLSPPAAGSPPAPVAGDLAVALLAFGWQMSLASANLIIHKSVRSVETFRQCK